jgi:Raf kinase inhibitor-like YbhB/YbcL family protein
MDAQGDVATVADAPADVPVGNGMLTLTSSAVMNNGVIAMQYRCMTMNVSLPLSWTPGPAGTMSYAVTLVHGGAAYHWVIWDIPASTTSLPEGVMRVAMPPVPPGSKQTQPGLDGSTWYGYTGPCPQSANQSYLFTVYALKVANAARRHPSIDGCGGRQGHPDEQARFGDAQRDGIEVGEALSHSEGGRPGYSCQKCRG